MTVQGQTWGPGGGLCDYQNHWILLQNEGRCVSSALIHSTLEPGPLG